MKKIVIVGGGVSTYYFLLLVSLRKLKEKIRIEIYSKEDVFPSVSSSIIPIITRNGIEKGNSALGVLLYESFFVSLKINSTEASIKNHPA